MSLNICDFHTNIVYEKEYGQEKVCPACKREEFILSLAEELPTLTIRKLSKRLKDILGQLGYDPYNKEEFPNL